MASEHRLPEELVTTIERLERSDHLCISCDTIQEELAAAISFIRGGVERHEQCVYVADAETRPTIRAALQAAGITAATDDPTAPVSLIGAPTTSPGEAFDPERMLEWVAAAAGAATGAGFAGLRLVGEMRCVAGGTHLGVQRLARFEAALNVVLQKYGVTGLCIYDRRRFPSHIIRGVIATHPLVVVGSTVCENPFFVPPAAYLSADWGSHEVDWLLENLSRLERARRELHDAQDRYHGLAHRLLETQETERRTVARELHDDLGQRLTAIKMILLAARSEPWWRGQKLAEGIALIDESMEQLRTTLLDLRPPMLDDLGLAAALRWYVNGHAERAGLTVHLDVASVDGVRLPSTLETACFRLAQEALTNVLRHARARHVEVTVRMRDGEVEVVVRDHGIGFDVAAARARVRAGASLGLLTMEERAALAGGRLEIESAPGAGTTVRARFRLADGAPHA